MASRKRKTESPQMGLGLPFRAESQCAPDSPDFVSAGSPLQNRRETADSGPAAPHGPTLSLSLSPSDPLPGPGASGGNIPNALGATDLDLESFDDYDDHAIVGDVPRLRLVDPPRECPSVIVEALECGHFEVSRLRNNGTTVANVRYTRKELEELVMRAQSALEM